MSTCKQTNINQKQFKEKSAISKQCTQINCLPSNSSNKWTVVHKWQLNNKLLSSNSTLIHTAYPQTAEKANGCFIKGNSRTAIFKHHTEANYLLSNSSQNKWLSTKISSTKTAIFKQHTQAKYEHLKNQEAVG